MSNIKVANGLQSRGNLSGQYYRPIPRIDDLADINAVSLRAKLRNAEVYIAPARIALDALVERAISGLEARVIRLKGLPNADDIVAKNIGQIIKEIGIDKAPTYKIKGELKREGYTGELIAAAQRLNRSLSNVNRHILSKKGLFYYLAYKSIYGLDVEDVPGIIANITASLDQIKAYLNGNLVDRVIAAKSLKVTEEERKALKARFSKIQLSYSPGQVTSTILKEFELMKQGGGLLAQAKAFLQSSSVKLPYGIDKEEVAEKMVEYLIQIGYPGSGETSNEEGESTGGVIADDGSSDEGDSASEGTGTEDVNGEDVSKMISFAVREELEKAIPELKQQLLNTLNAIIKSEIKSEMELLKKDLLVAIEEMIGQGTKEREKQRIELRDIEGIGRANLAKLNEKGITTVEQLAVLSLDDLAEILGSPTGIYSFDVILKQANLWVEGMFKEFKELQDSLNPRNKS